MPYLCTDPSGIDCRGWCGKTKCLDAHDSAQKRNAEIAQRITSAEETNTIHSYKIATAHGVRDVVGQPQNILRVQACVCGARPRQDCTPRNCPYSSREEAEQANQVREGKI